MMSDNGQDMANFAERIRQVCQKLQGREIDHFELFGLQKTATIKEIEEAYQRYSRAFPKDKIASITDPETRKMGEEIAQRIDRAYEVLSDYEKKAEYEKRGFKEEAPEKEDLAEEQARTLYKKAKSLHAQRQYRPAIQVMEEAVKLDARIASYYLLLGMCQSQIPGLKKEAEQNLQKAAEMEAWNAEPQAALGMLFYSERLYKRAESHFKKALELEPSHALARRRLLEISGPKETALDKVQKSLEKYLPTIFGRKKKEE